MEILGHNPIYRKIRDIIKPNKDYLNFPLKKEIINRIIHVNKIPGRKSFFEGRLNRGEIGSLLIKLRKHAIAFNMEFLSPIFGKEINELFFDISGEQLMCNGVKRSLIKGAMKNIVPVEIINRTDKMPFSPDCNKRIAKVKRDDWEHLFKNKTPIEKSTGLDLELLSKLLSKIKKEETNTEWQINKELFFIPLIIILAEFYLYLASKSYEM